MSIGDINTQLYRPLADGKKYDKLIPSATGVVSPLAEGNTKVAIDNMVRWAVQYASQTKALAPKLKGRTLAETCRNIHSFLYNHIQYKLDGYNQNLRSPSSTWENRKEGTDCKSYSIFGSTILQNLNIPHYFRRIKQEAVNPDAYTHVYIIGGSLAYTDINVNIGNITENFTDLSFENKSIEILLFMKKEAFVYFFDTHKNIQERILLKKGENNITEILKKIWLNYFFEASNKIPLKIDTKSLVNYSFFDKLIVKEKCDAKLKKKGTIIEILEKLNKEHAYLFNKVHKINKEMKK